MQYFSIVSPLCAGWTAALRNESPGICFIQRDIKQVASEGNGHEINTDMSQLQIQNYAKIFDIEVILSV